MNIIIIRAVTISDFHGIPHFWFFCPAHGHLICVESHKEMYRSYYLNKIYLQFKKIYLYNLNIIMFTRVRLGLCLILEKKSPFSKILISHAASWFSTLKVHAKMKISLCFTHPRGILGVYDFLLSDKSNQKKSFFGWTNPLTIHRNI